MKILYISSMYDNDTYASLYTKEKKPMHAANKYHTLLCEGLAKAGATVNTYSVLPINKEFCDQLYIKVKTKKKENLKTQYISTYNVPVLKNLLVLAKSFFKALCAPKGTVIIYDVLVLSASKGALWGAKLRRFKKVGLVTDLPDYMEFSRNPKAMKMSNKIYKAADGYIFLTQQMDEATNPDHKPYIVLEGHVDSEMISRPHEKFDEDRKTVIYAGSLKRIYGIPSLVKSFANVSKPNEELHVYGDGDYAESLKNVAEKHPNIIFHGNCPNGEVVDAELRATLLVNPRPTAPEYTKYSFPSKTLEYMVSGTPVLTSKLPGIPSEYDGYLYYFDDNIKGDLDEKLREILDKPTRELCEMGESARSFALEKKNNVSQAKKIIDFCLSFEKKARK